MFCVYYYTIYFYLTISVDRCVKCSYLCLCVQCCVVKKACCLIFVYKFDIFPSFKILSLLT